MCIFVSRSTHAQALPFTFPAKILTYSSPLSKAYVNLLRSVSRNIYGASTDREAVHTAVSFRLQSPHQFLSGPNSPLNPLSICTSLNERDQVSNAYKTGEIKQTLSAPTNTLFCTLCSALLICCCMVWYNCHLQGAYRTVSQWPHIPTL